MPVLRPLSTESAPTTLTPGSNLSLYGKVKVRSEYGPLRLEVTCTRLRQEVGDFTRVIKNLNNTPHLLS